MHWRSPPLLIAMGPHPQQGATLWPRSAPRMYSTLLGDVLCITIGCTTLLRTSAAATIKGDVLYITRDVLYVTRERLLPSQSTDQLLRALKLLLAVPHLTVHYVTRACTLYHYGMYSTLLPDRLYITRECTLHFKRMYSTLQEDVHTGTATQYLYCVLSINTV